MNLIIHRQLDRSEELAIHELTLKKRQSKKSTMSEKQLRAKHQLAHELSQERKVPLLVESIRQTLSRLDSIASNASTSTSTTTSMSSSSSSSSSASQDLQSTLDQLNDELELKLHLYERLVAQEKALLGVHNKNLFARKGVGNSNTTDFR